MKALNVSSREKIRRLRKKRGLTLKALAEYCHCSSGYLSRVETGAVNPSLATLMATAEALNVTVDELFYTTPSKPKILPCLMHPDERKTLSPKTGIQMQLLSRGIDVPFEFLQVTFPPGTSDGMDIYSNEGDDLHTHEGAECGLVLQGVLDVQVDDKTYRLKAGDTITLYSSSSHKISNTGDEEAVAVWVDSKPFLFSTI
ncbi:MAG: helix-turn-helix transcriptional regulator [Deltaproteobacteria bacterium]|nr:helix-turn-helix transcriptional regulator [Deltaproteobacteria bacterium]